MTLIKGIKSVNNRTIDRIIRNKFAMVMIGEYEIGRRRCSFDCPICGGSYVHGYRKSFVHYMTRKIFEEYWKKSIELGMGDEIKMKNDLDKCGDGFYFVLFKGSESK